MNQKQFWILLIVVHGLFMGKQIFYHNSLIQDSKEYILAAENLIQNKTLYAWHLHYAYNPDWLSKRPFLYPAILASFKWLSLGSDKAFFFLAYLFQNLASLFSLYLCLHILKIKQIPFKYGHAGFFMICSLSQFIYANLIMSEIYLQLCMVGIVYLLITKKMRNTHYLYISLLCIAGMSLKPVFMLSAFLYPLLVLAFHYKQLLVKPLLISLLPLLFYFSICQWNARRTGYFHYSSISNINLLHYNTYSLLIYLKGKEKADSVVEKIYAQAQLMPTYADGEQFIRQSCQNEILKNPLTYTFLHLRGIVFSLLDPGRFDQTQFFQLRHEKNILYEINQEGAFKRVFSLFLNPLGLLLLLLFLFNAFRTWMGVQFLFNRKIQWTLKLAVLLFPVYILGLTGPIGSSRFFMPVIPFAFLAFLFIFRKKETPKLP